VTSSESGYWARTSGRYTRRGLLGRSAAGLVALSSASLLGCGSRRPATAPAANAGNGAGSPKSGGTFFTYNAANLGPLDPQGGAGASSAVNTNSVYGGLLRFRAGADPQVFLNLDSESNLAASIESVDGQTWTVKLRSGARFHDVPPVSGHAVEAADVQATFKRAFSIANNTNKSLLTMIDPNQIEAPTSDTVVFKLKYPFGPFRNALAGAGFEILPREALAGAYDPQKVPIGTGAYMFGSYTPDVELVLKKNPAYIEQGRPYADTIHVAIIPDASQQIAQFTAGHLDELRPAPNDLATVKQSSPKALILGAPSDHSWSFFGHMDHPSAPFHDLQVRQALSMAIDRETLGKAIYAGQYSKNGVIPAVLGKWALPPDQLGDASKFYEYNLDAAKKIVESSAAAKQIKRFLYPSVYYGTQFDTLCQSVSAMLNAAGFQIQLVAIDYNKDFIGGGKGALYGNYPDDSLLASREGIHNNAETTLSYNYQTGDDHNLPKVSDPQLDADLLKMMSTLDDGARLQAAYALQRYAAEQVYLIPLPSEFAYTVVAPRVQNYYYAPSTNEGGQSFPNLWLLQ